MTATLNTRTAAMAAPRRIWRSLAIDETRALTTHPAVLASLAAVLALLVIPLAVNPAEARFPYLTALSITVQYPLLILAGGTFMAANMIAMRPYRHKTYEFESVLSLPSWRRTAALAVATLGPATIGLVIAAAWISVHAAAPGAAGAVRVGEILAVPAVTMLAGLLGILVAEVARNTAAGFVTLMVLAIGTFVGLASDSRGRWLSFVAGQNTFTDGPMPASLLDRPEWWHLVWLLGLAAVTIGATLWLTGLRHHAVLALTAILAVVPVLGATAQLRPSSAELNERLRQAQTAPASQQQCVVRGSVTYCSFPEFRSRIDAWAQIVEAQLAMIPKGQAPEALHVRQHLPIPAGDQGVVLPAPLERWSADDAAAGTPNAIPVSTRWAAGGTDSFDETEVIGFSGWVAAVLISHQPLGANGTDLCGGRGAVALWLAASATPETAKALATVDSHTSGGGGVVTLPVLNSLAGLRVGEREAALAKALLTGDPATVRAAVTAQWTQLTDPGTDIARAAELLGLSAHGSASPDTGICP